MANSIHMNKNTAIIESRVSADPDVPEGTVSGMNDTPGTVQVDAATGKTTHGGPVKVNTYDEHTFQTLYGSPCNDMQEPLKPENHERFTIPYGSTRMTIASGLKAGLIEIDNGELSYVEHKAPVAGPEVNPTAHMDSNVARDVAAARQRSPMFDALFIAAASHTGEDCDPAKAEAALKRMAMELQAPDLEAARNLTSSVLEGVLTNALHTLADKYGEDQAEDTMKHYNNMDSAARTTHLNALYLGDPKAIDRLYEAYRLKNRR